MQKTYLLIGNVSVPLSWVAFVGASLVTILLLRWLFGKEMTDLFSDYLFTFVLVWKFSVVLTDFPVILQSPWTLLYFNGGTIGVLCGLLAVTLHLIIHMQKQKVHIHQLYGLSIGTIQLQSIIQLIIVLVGEEALLTKIVTVLGFGTILLFTISYQAKFQSMMREMNMIYIMAFLFLSAWQFEAIWQLAVLTAIIIGSVWVILYTYNEKRTMGVEQ